MFKCDLLVSDKLVSDQYNHAIYSQLFTVVFGASILNLDQHPRFVMHDVAATICVQIWRDMLNVCIQPCFVFSGGYHTTDTFETQLQDGNLCLYGW